MRKSDKRSNRLQRFLAGFLAAVMVLGLVMGSGVTMPVRAAEAETTEEAGSAEKNEQEAKAEVSKEETAAEEKAEVSKEETATEDKADVSEEPGSDKLDDTAESGDKPEEDEKTEQKEESDETEAKSSLEDSLENSSEVEKSDDPVAESDDDGVGESGKAGKDTEENSENVGTLLPGGEEAGTSGLEPEAQKAEGTKLVQLSLYERLMASNSKEEWQQIISEYTEEELAIADSELTNEQHTSLIAKKRELGMLPSGSGSSGNTHAGPILWSAGSLVPAIAGNSKKRMLKSTRAANNGISLEKNIEQTGINTYKITLETYTTGEVTVVTEPRPVDIVLVLDTSGSMTDNITVGSKTDTSQLDSVYGGAEGIYRLQRDVVADAPLRYKNGRWEYYHYKVFSGRYGWDPVENSWLGNSIYISKQNALKIAAQRFVDAVKEKAQQDNVEHRISIVSYSTSANPDLGLTSVISGESTLKNTIKGLGAVGATRIDLGTNEAESILNGAPDDHGKVMIMFTDGVPTTQNTFDNNVANAAISTSHDLKADGVTVYSVGVYGTDPGNNVKTFMNFYSSNYKNATSMTNGGTQTGSGYFLTASSAADITEIFESIAHAIQTPTISLTEETTIKDIVTPQFTLPANTTDIKVYTDNSIGGENFANNRVLATGVDIAINDATMTVTGFNFNENFVSETPKDGANDYGKKLIIEFVVELDPDYLGGSALETNGPDSGVFDPEGNTVANFDVPSVDVPLKKIEPITRDWNVYLSTEDELSNMFKGLQFTIGGQQVNYDDIFDGVNNHGADVEFNIMDSHENVVYTYTIPAGATAGNWHDGDLPTLTDEHYTVSCTVKDHKNGNNHQDASSTININVFKPILTYNDKNVYFKGDQIDVSAVTPTVVWKHGNTSDTAVSMDTTKPILTYEYSGVAGTTVDQTTDYTVKVEKIGKQGNDSYDFLDDEVIDSVTFLRDCEMESMDDAEASAEEAFKIHVYTPSYAFEDMEAYYGDTVDIDSQKPASTTWKNGDTEAPSQMDNTAPTITIELTPEEGAVNNNGYVAVKEDFDVAAVIKVGNTDITSALISAGKITRTCDIEGEDCGDNPEVTTSKAFVVHVKTVTLDVKKEIAGFVADLTKTYDFTVTVTPAQGSGLSSETKSQTLGNNGMLEMTGLPKGASFTVTEKTVPDNYTVTAKVNGETASVTDGTETGAKVVNGTLAADENHVIITNKLEEIPLTGVNIPVIYLELLIVCGAAIGFVLIALRSRKKREIRNS